MPMVRVPDRTFRTRVKGDETYPPRYWDLWEYLPDQQRRPAQFRRKVYLGRSERTDPERMTRTKTHRFIPSVALVWPREFEQWVEGIAWLQQVYREHNPDSGLPPLT